MLARLQAGREGPAGLLVAFHAAAAETGLIARRIVEPEIVAEWSILWAERAQSAAITRFLESARRCAEEHDWPRSPMALSA